MHIREATQDDREVIWEWANDPETRAQSFDRSAIPWRDHVAWFEGVLADEYRILVVGCDPEPVGMVRFDIDGDDATISVNLAPTSRGRGLGVRLITEATAWFHERHPMAVTAWIRPTNLSSVRAFDRAGYRRTSSERADRLRYEHHGPSRVSG